MSSAARRCYVLVVCAGGIDSGGGIGRQMGYFLKEQKTKTVKPIYQIVDTRGPKFLGGSIAYTALAGLYLAASVVTVSWTGLTRHPSLAHVNIAGRGSAIRKIAVCAAARAVRLPYILHVHDSNFGEEYRRRGAAMQFLLRRTFRGAARVIVLGSRDQSALTTLMELPPGQALILHNAVPDPDPAVKAQSDDKCTFVFLGTLSERKGFPELMQALGSPAMASRQWRAILAGDGPIEDYKRLAERLGIAERLEFPGWVDQSGVRKACEAADVLVLPSHAEGLAMSVLEGLSYGLAVVTTPVGAHTEVIEPEVSGLFVPPGDVEALAAALVRVVDDPALRRRLGAGARRRFLDKFNVRVYAEQLALLHGALM